MKTVVIIGAGMGGLTAALRLWHLGFDVTVIEKRRTPGRRWNLLQERGCCIDTGPSILVMKESFDETYRAVGQDLDRCIEFVQLDPNYRIYYHDGTCLELHNCMARLAAACENIEKGVAIRLFTFIGESARTYQLGMEFMARNYDHITDVADPAAAYRNLYTQAGAYFKTDRLRKTFSFHSMFLGVSPFEAPQIYSLITYADLVYTYKRLVPGRVRMRCPDGRLDRMCCACSGYVLYLGVDRVYHHLRHQVIYFTDDYRANLDAVFRSGILPADPSFHLSCPTVNDPGLAPPGHSILYLLAPMPNLRRPLDWEEASPVVRDQLLKRLEELVDPDIRRHIVWEGEYRPVDWERDINAPYGVAFGSLSHNFFQSSYFRPHNVACDIPGLYFVG